MLFDVAVTSVIPERLFFKDTRICPLASVVYGTVSQVAWFDAVAVTAKFGIGLL